MLKSPLGGLTGKFSFTGSTTRTHSSMGSCITPFLEVSAWKVLNPILSRLRLEAFTIFDIFRRFLGLSTFNAKATFGPNSTQLMAGSLMYSSYALNGICSGFRLLHLLRNVDLDIFSLELPSSSPFFSLHLAFKSAFSCFTPSASSWRKRQPEPLVIGVQPF